MTKEPQFGTDTTEENKRKALDALDLRGSRHDAAAAADVSVKTLDDWRRGDAQFAAEWDATIERVMTRLREQPLDDKGNFKRSPLQYGLKATDENKEIVLAMLANGATYAAAAAAVGAHRRTIMKWADADEEFAQRWNDAIEEGIDRLEQEAIRRARDGVKRPVFYMGQIVGYGRTAGTACSRSGGRNRNHKGHKGRRHKTACRLFGGYRGQRPALQTPHGRSHRQRGASNYRQALLA
jgi:hypothetical protein